MEINKCMDISTHDTVPFFYQHTHTTQAYRREERVHRLLEFLETASAADDARSLATLVAINVAEIVDERVFRSTKAGPSPCRFVDSCTQIRSGVSVDRSANQSAPF